MLRSTLGVIMRRHKTKIALVVLTWAFSSSVSAASIILAENNTNSMSIDEHTLIPIGVVLAAIAFAVKTTWSFARNHERMESRLESLEAGQAKTNKKLDELLSRTQ